MDLAKIFGGLHIGRQGWPRNASSTKRGPGRRHVNGTQHGKPNKAAPGDWLGQHTNPQRNRQRAMVEALGARQVRKRSRAARREQRVQRELVAP